MQSELARARTFTIMLFKLIITFQKSRKLLKSCHVIGHKNLTCLHLANPKKDVVFGIGPAGTGKTLIAVLTAIKFFKEGIVDKIIVTRPAVSVDEDLGFLPGTLEQKMAPWTRPIFDVLREYFTV